MDGPRAPLETELPRVVRFLDSHLRPEEKWSITSEYPLAFVDANRANIRIITENEEVLSHAVMRPLLIKTPVGLFKVGAIGSVVTSTHHRHQGLSTKTLESCIEAARASACDFAILWTNLYDFYRRMGFELGGTELSILIDRELHPPASKVEDQTLTTLKFMDSNRIAPEAIHRLYSQHSVASLRSMEDTRRYLQIPNTRVYTAWDQNGALKAYAIEGKGADLNGYIHEWGGGVSHLVPLLSHVYKTQARPVTVIVPGHAQNLLRTFEAQGLVPSVGFLGMMKLLNTGQLFAKIKRHARNLGIPDLAFERQGDKYYLGTKDGLFSTDSEQDIIKLVFGPQKPSQIHQFEPEVAAALDKVLPLQMWIWGWDSI